MHDNPAVVDLVNCLRDNFDEVTAELWERRIHQDLILQKTLRRSGEGMASSLDSTVWWDQTVLGHNTWDMLYYMLEDRRL